MKIYFYCTMLFISALLFSCKKSSTSASVCRISTIVVNTTDSLLISYDGSGRPTVILDKDQMAKIKFTYTGSTGKRETFDLVTGTLFGTANLTFDAKGRLTSYEEFHMFGGDNLRYYYQFEYNSEGYLFRNIQTLTGGSYNTYYVDSLVYSNGNLDKDYTKFNDGSLYTITDYQYSTDVNNDWNYFLSLSGGEPFSILSGYYDVLPLLGNHTKNLPKKIIVSGTGTSDIYDFTFSLDASNQVTGYSHVRNYNTVITNKTVGLTHTCN